MKSVIKEAVATARITQKVMAHETNAPRDFTVTRLTLPRDASLLSVTQHSPDGLGRYDTFLCPFLLSGPSLLSGPLFHFVDTSCLISFLSTRVYKATAAE